MSFNEGAEIVDAGDRTGHTESEFEVLVMMSKMVFLHCPHVRRKLCMVQAVVLLVVRENSREYSCSRIVHAVI